MFSQRKYKGVKMPGCRQLFSIKYALEELPNKYARVENILSELLNTVVLQGKYFVIRIILFPTPTNTKKKKEIFVRIQKINTMYLYFLHAI